MFTIKKLFLVVSLLFFSQNLFSQDTTAEHFKPFCFSAGIGIPYGGGYGPNIEICPIEYCGINFGFGDPGGSNNKIIIGYAFGLRVYVLDQKSIVRPFILVNYGTVAKSQKKTIYSSNGIPVDWSGIYEGPTTVEGTAISLGVRIYNFDVGVTLKKYFDLPDGSEEVKDSIPLNDFLLAVAFYF